MDNTFLDITLNNDSTTENWTSDIIVPQYSTNTVIRVAYRNSDPNVYMYIVFESNNVRKILKPDTRRKLEGVVGKTYSFQLTQYETQYYVGEKKFSVVIQNMSGTDIAINEYSFKMKKMPYNVFENLDLNKDSGLLGVAKGVQDNARDIADLTALIGSVSIEGIQADWDETDVENRSYIKNKPTKLSQFENDIADPNDYYTKTETDDKLDKKANISDIGSLVNQATLNNYYTKTEADKKFITETVNNLINYYTNDSVDSLLKNKADASKVYTKEEVNTKLSNIPKFTIKVVSSLPTTDISDTTIYLLRKSTPASGDYYDEYIYVGGSWEFIGSSTVDLSNYYTKDQVDSLLENISLDNYYTKSELDVFLSNKVSTSTLDNYYTKGESNTLINKKADTDNVYTKSVVDNLLKDKANASNTYTKEQIDGVKSELTQYINDQDYAYIGRENQVDFNATLSGGIITGTLDESVKDFEFTNNSTYLFHIYLPLTTISGDLDDSYTIKLLDKNGKEINILTIFQKDVSKTSTVGDLCQIQDYDVDIGYSWEFRGSYRELTEKGVLYRTIYTDAPIRELNTALTGVNLYQNIIDKKLKNGVVVICTLDYTNGDIQYKKGHSYKIVDALKGTVEDITALDEEYLQNALDTLETKIGGTINIAIEGEVTNRNNAITSAIAGEVENRNTAINSVISSEISNRETAISSAISSEVANRDAAISAAINSLVDSAPGTLDTLKELSAALGDDPNFAATITEKLTAIEGKVTAETSARESADTALEEKITAETTARKTADNTLQGNIDSVNDALTVERNSRAADDKTLQSNIDTVSGKIDTEVSNRTSEITRIEGLINSEAKSRTDKDTALETAISNEVQARTTLEEKAYTTDNLVYSKTAPENPATGTLWIYDATDSGESTSIDDANVSTSTTYSSSKIDTTYAKKTDIPEVDLSGYLLKTGDTMSGNLNAPAFTIDATTAATGDKALNDGSLVFKYKNSNEEPWYAWLTMNSVGQLQFASHGGLASEIGIVATQQWVKKQGYDTTGGTTIKFVDWGE